MKIRFSTAPLALALLVPISQALADTATATGDPTPRVDHSMYYAGGFLAICAVIIGAQMWPMLKKHYFPAKKSPQEIIDAEAEQHHS